MTYLNRKKCMVIQIGSVLTFVLLGIASTVYAGQVNVPYTFSPGTTISSSQVNDNFQALAQSMPGMKSVGWGGSVTLSTTWQNIASITVTPPADGMLLLMGMTNVTIYYDNGGARGDQSVVLCITQTSGGSNSSPGCQCGSEVSFSVPQYGAGDGPRIQVPAAFIANVGVVKNTSVTYYLTAAFPGAGKQGSGTAGPGGLVAIFLPGGYLLP